MGATKPAVSNAGFVEAARILGGQVFVSRRIELSHYPTSCMGLE
jgi:hypothetical protein